MSSFPTFNPYTSGRSGSQQLKLAVYIQIFDEIFWENRNRHFALSGLTTKDSNCRHGELRSCCATLTIHLVFINTDSTWSSLASERLTTTRQQQKYALSLWNSSPMWTLGTHITYPKYVYFINEVLFVPQFSFQVFDHPMSRGFQNRFSTQYRCYSVSMLAGPNDRSDVEKGGKSKHHYCHISCLC